MGLVKLDAARVGRAKRAFSGRRVPRERLKTLLTGNLVPEAGDLVLARVDELGKQTRIELTDGRRAHLFPGDEIVVSYGNRYAPDQYEAVVPEDLSPCDLVAAGGIAGRELSRHERIRPPTKITPLGLIGDASGRRLNLIRFGVEAGEQLPEIPVMLSLGTSMNAGKTLTATSMVRGLKRAGFRVAALKITGTGAGGDMWIVRDAGADVALDFTDAGYATTYLTPIGEIERAAYRLLNHAAALGCEIAVIEIADGLQQLETAQLIRSPAIQRITLGTIFAAYDAMGAKYGVDVLRGAGHAVLAMSGRLGLSPLGVREAELATGLKVYSPFELQDGALVPAIQERASDQFAASGYRARGLGRIVQTIAVAERSGAAYPSASDLASRRVIAFKSLVRPAPDTARAVLKRVADCLMQQDVARLCHAGFGARNEGRTNRRNGFRSTIWATPVGPIPVRVPRLRNGWYRPTFLERPIDERSMVGAVADVLGAADRNSREAALQRLFVALGGESPVQADIARLGTEIGRLAGTGPAEGSRRTALPGGFANGAGSWISVARNFEQDDDDGTLGPNDLETVQDAGGTEPEEDDISVEAMFHPSHVIAGE